MDLKMEDVRMDDGEDNAEEEGEDAGRKQELMDESAAWRAVQEGLRSSSKSSTSPSGSCGPEGGQKDAAVGEDQTKLLAGKNRERMKKILENDRTKLGKVKEAKVLGVPLWESKPRPGDHDAAMVIQSPFPSLPNGHPALRLLGSVWHGEWTSCYRNILLILSSIRCCSCCDCYFLGDIDWRTSRGIRPSGSFPL